MRLRHHPINPNSLGATNSNRHEPSNPINKISRLVLTKATKSALDISSITRIRPIPNMRQYKVKDTQQILSSQQDPRGNPRAA